ncbi:MAG: lipopolysaccharide biosynthesis protein [Bacteroides sp.]|nr:lipopolysaccharide biosynthesis protein [Bacteroides sp.]
MSDSLKAKTVNALVWSTIDKVFTQVSYAVTGVILANILPPEDFGLLGIILVFVAFANIFSDSGFTMALVQKKVTISKDYSTVFFFNLGICLAIYLLLFLTAPWIAGYYEEPRLILLTRVVCLQIIFISLGLVQTGILMKTMNIRKLTLANLIALSLSAVFAILLALYGYGIWALVVQVLSISFFKTLVLWVVSSWRPQAEFSRESLRSTFAVGSHMMLASFISTFFQNIYTLLISTWYSIRDLGFYTQADKWSRMGITALSQTIGNAIFPALASIQDDNERMYRIFGKMSRMTAYLSFPVFVGLILVTTPLFHTLFGDKWNQSVPMFQLFLLKGIFFVLTSLLNNYIMAIGKTRIIFRIEVIKNILTLVAIFVTLPMGIIALIIGQVVVGVIQYLITSYNVQKVTGYGMWRQTKDLIPYVALTGVMGLGVWGTKLFLTHDILLLVTGISAGACIYLLLNRLLGSHIQQELFAIVLRKKKL